MKETKGSDVIYYLYEQTGMIGLEINGVPYYYVRNLQGDVTKIIDASGNVVVKYVYDSWGKVLSVTGSLASTVGAKNPIRYRGYYYDTESELYYLNSRYYDPETGRFISPDDHNVALDAGEYNLYTYCMNDPVNNSDPTGYWSWKTFWKGAGLVVTGVVAVALAATTFGAGIPVAMSIIAGITLAAGTLTTINGVATMVEAGTDYNFVRDGLFNEVLNLSDNAYNIYSDVTAGVAAVGSTILGAYHTTGQYKAAKYGQKYLGSGYKKVDTNRWVSKDGMRQMRFDSNHHLIDGEKSPTHINIEAFTHNYWQGGKNPITWKAHILYKFFRMWIR